MWNVHLLIRLGFQHSAVILEGCETFPREEFDTENFGVLLGRAMFQCWVFYPDESGMRLANACGGDGTDVSLLFFQGICVCG